MKIKNALLFLFIIGAMSCGAPKIGDSCDETKDCADIAMAYCTLTQICVAPCQEVGAACGEGGKCVEAYDRTVCLPACHDDGQCRDSDRCMNGACVLTNPLAEP